MERIDLDKYKMINTERAKECAYYLYQLWEKGEDTYRVHYADLKYPNPSILFDEMKKVRIVAVQIIAETTGRKYDPDLFYITRKGLKGEYASGYLYVQINRTAPYKDFNRENPITEETEIEEIKPYVTSNLFNSLKKSNFETVGDALSHTDKEIRATRNFGKIRLSELKDLYNTFGIFKKEAN